MKLLGKWNVMVGIYSVEYLTPNHKCLKTAEAL